MRGHEYKYLGFIVPSSGEIGTGLKDLRNRAMRGLAKIRKSLVCMYVCIVGHWISQAGTQKYSEMQKYIGC